MAEKLAAAVVTCNRKDLLRRCLRALSAQTRPLDKILVLDNASSDGTEDFLRKQGLLDHPSLQFRRENANVGGAGGFHLALKQLHEEGFDSVWLLDDDALPEPDALAQLIRYRGRGNAIYGSLALSDGADPRALCWPARVIDGSPRTIVRADHLSDVAEVTNIPFLGFLITRAWIDAVGLPEAGFFLSGDDTEYCARLRKHGARIFLVKHSVIRHPMPQRRMLKLAGREVAVLDLPPWKRYYEVRNRLLIARRHHGFRLWTEALPGTLLRWLVVLKTGSDRWPQSRAFGRGLIDGLLGRDGIRWSPGKRRPL